MTEDYCKLASGIILSTIWREDDHTRILWITMLAVKGRDHRVLASVPGLAAVANIPVDSCRAGLVKLSAPDPDSRTKEHEGRRIQEVDGGWIVLNGEKYRNYLSKQERNEYQARLMATRRATEKTQMLAPVSTKLAQLAQAEAEAEADKEVHVCDDPKPAQRKFTKPSFPELELHAAKIGLPTEEIEKFQDYYEANGWRVGKNPMKSWEAAMRNWKRNFDQRRFETGNNQPLDYAP